MISSKRLRLALSVMVLALAAPSALFFFAALGRSLQPTNHEPSRTLDALVSWFGGLNAIWEVGLLVLLPLVACALAVGLLWRTWQTEATARAEVGDLGRALAALLRRPALVVAVVVLAFGLLYFATVTVHAIAG